MPAMFLLLSQEEIHVIRSRGLVWVDSSTPLFLASGFFCRDLKNPNIWVSASEILL